MKKEEKDKLSLRLTKRLAKADEDKKSPRPLTIFNVKQSFSPEESDDLEHILASLEDAVKKREQVKQH